MQNYYDIVVAVARMINNPKISWREFQKVAYGYANRAKIELDEKEMKVAWREFSTASAPRIIYYR
jgi:hypothetical protein